MNEQEIKALKERANFLDLISSYGMSYKRVGSKDYAIVCPFHNDKNASLIITPEKGLWNCFGCGRGGDIIDFICRYEEIGFKEAVKKLGAEQLERNAEACANTPQQKERNENPTSKIISERTCSEQEILNRVVEIYRETYKKIPRAKEYLAEREIKKEEIGDVFSLGYSEGKLLEIVPNKGDVLEDLKRVGIITEQGKEFFSGCVIFPIIDRHGNVVHIYGRKIDSKEGKHYYLRGRHQGVFNANILSSYNEIILTESIIDALSVYEAGLVSTIPIYGVNGLTKDHIGLMKEYKTKEIFVLLDADEAGRNGSQVIKDTLESNLECERIEIINFPEGEDANSFLIKHGKEKLREYVLGEIEKAKEKGKKSLPNKEEVKDANTEIIIQHCKRRYIVRGIETGTNKLKINVKCEIDGDAGKRFHIDTIDLYLAKARKAFIKDVSELFFEKVEVIEKDLNQIIEKVEAHIKEKQENKILRKGKELTRQEIEEAMNLAKSENLIEEILKDIEACGYIGEELNKLVGYLAMTSRKTDEPLSVLVISGSGAGKSSLQDTVLSMCPEEDLIKLTSLTGKALFYKQENSLAHKVLAIEEEQGAEEASYAIRNLISAKELTIEAAVKDNYTGKITTMENKVQGPTSVFKTTTNPETDYETKNRFIVLSIDESKEQTQKILEFQREMQTIEGILTKEGKEKIKRRHKNFQRILGNVKVVNPYAKNLTYLDDRIQVRREHPKYLNIINTIAFLRQYQKVRKNIIKGEKQIEYIEVDVYDIELANQIAGKVLIGVVLELSEPDIDLYNKIKQMTKHMATYEHKSCHQIEFTRRQVREFTNWSDHQIKTHLRHLVELEYVTPARGKKGQQYRYRILAEDEVQNKEKFQKKLIDIEKLQKIKSYPQLGDLAKPGEMEFARFYEPVSLEETGVLVS